MTKTASSTDTESAAREPADRALPPESSFAKSLFAGRLPATMAFPYPRLDHDEQRRVDALVGAARDFLDTHYDPAQVEQDQWVVGGVPLIVLAGFDYGSGSSRDWAAKGTLLLGVRAVLATSFERIHRSNLIGMRVLPLQFERGQAPQRLGLTGEEVYSITRLDAVDPLPRKVTVRVQPDGQSGQSVGTEFTATVRIDTPAEAAYFRHGGILPYVLRQLLEADESTMKEI